MVFDPASIFFEYGAESGVLQPPWDWAGPNGAGVTTGSYVRVDTEHVRTGMQAVKFYQIPPVKSDAQRRVSLRYDGNRHAEKEGYFSWYVYIDSNILEDSDPLGKGIDIWGPNLGGWQMWFGPSWDKYYWWEAVRFHIHSTTKKIQWFYTFGRGKPPEPRIRFHPNAYALGGTLLTDYDMHDYVGQWVIVP